jgi:succinate dehydrogenase/fumarate reductase flavoprotein subunit
MTDFDVVVLGSGAAGLVVAARAAEAGLRVGLFEKGEALGGTTALSGGIVWVPDNPYMHAAGVGDSREEALAYLESLSFGMIDPAFAEAFVDTGVEALRWLETTPVSLELLPGYPDYHPERPGGKPGGGRSLHSGLFDYRQLGEWAAKVIPSRMPWISLIESPLGGGDGRIPPEVLEQRRRDDIRGSGQALVGGLLKSCLDHGVALHLSTPAHSLLVEDGRVAGVRFDSPDGQVSVRAAAGVVIATGGFEWDTRLVTSFLRGPMTDPAGVPTNTGDGLRMAMQAGASIANMREAWWVPVVRIPGDEAFGRQRSHLILRERTLPRSIMVNKRGRRFTNEAANYNALGGAFHQFDAGEFDYVNLPCWLVFDQEYIDRYGFASSPPGTVPPYLTSSETLDGLAREIGVAPEGLVASVERWNEHARQGRDPDFGRGDSAYDSWSGDTSQSGRLATIGPIDAGPYYAIEMHSGTLGTKGGPRTTIDGEVLDHFDQPIPGLYAAGNAMAAPTGMVYGGAGGTLGPIIVFAYRTGTHLARTGVGASAG